MFDSKQKIIDFWFKETHPRQYYQKSNEFDNLIRKNFLDSYKLAKRGIFDNWIDTAQGCLAACILYDQFPRNMFRNTPQAFESDRTARKIASHAIANKFDDQLPSNQKIFLYLPFEHSEDIEDQGKSVELFGDIKEKEAVAYEYAVRHYDVIKKYGRFPHRNLIMGRPNTKEEDEYLSIPGAGF